MFNTWNVCCNDSKRSFIYPFFICSYLISDKRKFESMTAKVSADNIKMDLKETGWETEGWIKLADIFQQSNGRRIQFSWYGAVVFGNDFSEEIFFSLHI